MRRKGFTSRMLAMRAGIAVLILAALAGSQLAHGVDVQARRTHGKDAGDVMWGDGTNWYPWGSNDYRNLKSCQWIKINNKKGQVIVSCVCNNEGCGCKGYYHKRKPGVGGKLHVPNSCSNWPGGDQEGATLYELRGGVLEARGEATCGEVWKGCNVCETGFDTPVAQARSETPEPPGETSWFTADYDTVMMQSRILNHPQSTATLLSRSISGPDTLTMYPILPGEGLTYDTFGPQPAMVGIFVAEDPKGLPGTWVSVEFEVVNTGFIESFFDVFIETDLGWPITQQSFNPFLYPGESFFASTEVYIPEGTFPHTVCPVVATASGQGDVHEHMALLSVMPNVTIEIVPAEIVLHHGEKLQLTAILRNNTALPQTVDGWTEVVLPNGNPYSGNPVAGPRTPTLGPYAEIVRDLSHNVPSVAPVGRYIYTGYVGTYNGDEILDQSGFAFRIEHTYLVWEPDPTPISGQDIKDAVETTGRTAEPVENSLGDYNLAGWEGLFVCLGMYPNNYQIMAGSPEATQIENYIAGGGNVFMEGGNVWYYDPTVGGHDFGPTFGILAQTDGMGDLSTASGVANTIMPGLVGLTSPYFGENSSVDHLAPDPLSPLAEVVFSNPTQSYDIGIANVTAAGGHTVGTSYEIGGTFRGTFVNPAMAEIINWWESP